MKIKIGFTKPTAWFVPYSWIIRLGYGTSYSHVYLEWYSDSLDCRMIYEAAGSMIHFTSPIVFEQKEVILKQYSIEISDKLKRKMIRNCIMRCGIPYAIKESIGIGIVRIMGFCGIKLKKNPLGDGDSKSKCSELIYDILMEILSSEDKELLLEQVKNELDLISPLDIDNFLSTYPGAKREI